MDYSILRGGGGHPCQGGRGHWTVNYTGFLFDGKNFQTNIKSTKGVILFSYTKDQCVFS